MPQVINKGPINLNGPGITQGGSYYPESMQTNYESQAGVSAPQYYSSLDQSGNLRTPFVIDPTQSSAFKTMQDTATSTDLSPWAKMQEQSLANQTQSQRDQSNAQTQGATGTAIDKMMMSGNGADSGSRALALAMGDRSNIMANQNIGSQQTAQDLGIQQTDAQNKASMLGQVMNTQTSAQAANAQAGLQDLSNENQFEANRYTQQMQAWGAQKTADAQAQAAAQQGGGKK